MTKAAYVNSNLYFLQNWRDPFIKIRIFLTVFIFAIFLLSTKTYAQAVSPGLAPVIPPTGKFAIDGNLKANTPVAGLGDWLPAPGAGGAVLDNQGNPLVSSSTYHLYDLFNTGDNTFEGGQKKNDNPNNMKWKLGNPSPAKCDINNLLIHTGDDANGDTWITLSGDRESTNGNSFISLALHQKKLISNPNGTFTSDASNSSGGRSPGDLQISAEFTGGGVNPNLYLEEWRSVNGVYQWVAFSVTNVVAYGSTNAAQLTGLPYSAFGFDYYSINAFIEVSINITEVYRNTATPCVGSISSMFVMTKSSQAEKADLSDFVDPIQINLDVNVGKPTANGASYCVGATVDALTATGEQGAIFKWYESVDADGKPAGTATTGSSCTPTVNTSISGVADFYVTQTVKGCESQPALVLVTVNPNATASAGTAPTAQCYDAVSGNTFALDGSGTNGAPKWTVLTNTNNLTVGFSNDAIFKPTVTISGGSGSVTLRLTVTSGFTPVCGTPTSDVTVTLNANATASAGAAPAAQCYDAANGSTFALDGSGTNGTPKWTVLTNPNNLTVGFSDDGIFKPSVNISGGSGAVTLRLTVSSNFVPVCNNPTSDVTIIVNSPPTAVAGDDPSTQCYVANGNIFNLAGSGLNGNPVWTIAPNGNPSGLNVQFTGENTLTPSITISGSASGGTVIIRLTVTSNATPVCGSITDDVNLAVGPQVGAPDAIMLTPLCTDKTFKLQVTSPVSGTKYTVTQPLNNNPYSSEFLFDGTNGPVIFSGLTFGDGFVVVASKNGCTSASLDCPVQQIQSINNQLSSAPSTVNASIDANSQSAVLAYPNPYSDRIRFDLKSSVSGQGSLELYNMLGQKVKTIFQGYIEAGRSRNIEYSVPYAQRGNLVYVFRVNNQRTTGTLINIKR